MAEPWQAAIEHVRERSELEHSHDLRRIRASLGRSVDGSFIRDTVRATQSNCRLTMNFHPDRLTADRVSVAENLLRSGQYLPQSETGLSNGGRYPLAGGDRTRREGLLFGNAYDDPRTSAATIAGR